MFPIDIYGIFLFPILLITIALVVIYGFHSLISSGISYNQLNTEKMLSLLIMFLCL